MISKITFTKITATGEVHKNKLIKFLVTINIGISDARLHGGAVIDLRFPSTYATVFENCYDN